MFWIMRLQLQQIFPSDIKVGILHGKMKPDEKNAVMQAFQADQNPDSCINDSCGSRCRCTECHSYDD